MITMSRRNGEGIVIGDDIMITVVEVRGDRVRLAIECPQEVPLRRGEVFDAIRQATRPTMGRQPDQPTPPSAGP